MTLTVSSTFSMGLLSYQCSTVTITVKRTVEPAACDRQTDRQTDGRTQASLNAPNLVAESIKR